MFVYNKTLHRTLQDKIKGKWTPGNFVLTKEGMVPKFNILIDLMIQKFQSIENKTYKTF